MAMLTEEICQRACVRVNYMFHISYSILTCFQMFVAHFCFILPAISGQAAVSRVIQSPGFSAWFEEKCIFIMIVSTVGALMVVVV